MLETTTAAATDGRFQMVYAGPGTELAFGRPDEGVG